MANVIAPKNKGTQKLFQNPVLEKLSRTHIAVPLTIFSVFALGLLAWSVTHTSLSAGTTIGLFLLGMIAFTWVEYVVHRYVFHMKTYSAFRTKFQYIVHGVHHEYPKDKDRLAMPPLLSVTISTILLLLFRLVMGDFTFAFLPGFIVGYAAYLGVHYMVHAFAPPKNIFKFLWINHGTHHYKNGEMIYGVSSPLWDYVYGTMKEKKLSAK
ncbi:MAG TPA: sterol desaturase family protein [Chryseolinea sp.]|nr:sterol desaturase family protein [Chryseolinea sp.]